MRRTHQPVDANEISQLIAAALGATGVLPPMSRLEELNRVLRAEVERLAPLVHRQADDEPLQSRAWYRLIQTAERAQDTLNFQMGTAPLSGAIHVAELARRVQELRGVVVVGQ
jgi:hypothetical protein